MSGEYPPLTCKDVKNILTYLGFNPRPNKGTSHEQWVKVENGRLHKVTVDCPKSPFSQTLIKSMAEQAELKKKIFTEFLSSFNHKPNPRFYVKNRGSMNQSGVLLGVLLIFKNREDLIIAAYRQLLDSLLRHEFLENQNII